MHTFYYPTCPAASSWRLAPPPWPASSGPPPAGPCPPPPDQLCNTSMNNNTKNKLIISYELNNFGEYFELFDNWALGNCQYFGISVKMSIIVIKCSIFF